MGHLEGIASQRSVFGELLSREEFIGGIESETDDAGDEAVLVRGKVADCGLLIDGRGFVNVGIFGSIGEGEAILFADGSFNDFAGSELIVEILIGANGDIGQRPGSAITGGIIKEANRTFGVVGGIVELRLDAGAVGRDALKK